MFRLVSTGSSTGLQPVDAMTRGEGARGFGLYAGQNVLVGRHGESGVAWPSRSLTTLTGTPAFKERRVGVAKVVEPDARDAARSHDCVEDL